MREEEIRVGVDGGELHGHRQRDGVPALLLHGGPGFPDYTEGLAAELAGLFAVVRYTQRGTPPSAVAPPYSIESHVADALAVLDALDLEQAWVIGHSWGAHLGLHLALRRPERLLGFVGVGAQGAYDVVEEAGTNLTRGLAPDELARVEEVDARRRRGEATDRELLELRRLIWPRYFADPARASPMPTRIGVECSAETNASIATHLRRGTLVRGLPRLRLPALFVHGEHDPLPLRSVADTAALIPGGRVEVVERCGHFPWQERPGEARRAVERWMSDI